ncbi:hypothetical protein cypCar_00015530 [Cyprinus carpio]|nr:hypothetical protein cypCar_00015530 [Cyprinus carpio]
MSSADVSEQSRRCCVLSWEQVQRLDSILGECVPIHGRGNFPTLSVQPRHIVQWYHYCSVAWLTLACLADKVGLFVAHKVNSGLILLETVDLWARADMASCGKEEPGKVM